MKGQKKVQDEDQLTPEEQAEANALFSRIKDLEKKSQQFDDLKTAAGRGDHKEVFSRLGVRVQPTAAPAAKAPQRDTGWTPQQQQQQQQQFQQDPQLPPNVQQQSQQGGVGGPLDDETLQKVNSAFTTQQQMIGELRSQLQQFQQEVSMMRAESQNAQLRQELGRSVRSIIQQQGSESFLAHLDPDEVTDKVVRRLESFKKNYGMDTTVDEVLKQMNNEYKGVFDKFVEANDNGEYDDEEYEGDEEGQEAEGDDEGDEDVEDVQLPNEDIGSESDRPAPKIIDPYDEDRLTAETDAAIDAVASRQQGAQASL